MQRGSQLGRFLALAGIALVAALAILTPRPAAAQSLFERLVMPGPLIEGHAKLEGDCSNCHKSFLRREQKGLCLDCHKDVAADISRAEGFHGRSPDVPEAECRTCHTDHVGREAKVVRFDAETFDHGRTDFALEGSHAGVACQGCHGEGAKFRDAKAGCVDCHRRDEPHDGALGVACADCHTAVAWQETRPYDHSKTRFALKGAHQEVSCVSCHAGETYRDLPLDCAGCHSLQDVHAGGYGAECDGCHQPAKWTDIRFDHDTRTDFTLGGKHAEARCKDCHAPGKAADRQSTACFDCHREDDPHRGSLGEFCGTCHKPAGWFEEVAFDHDITVFPLIGLHALVPCEGCHIDADYHEAETACSGCHATDDFHEGRMSPRCESCHTPNGWDFWVFDHDSQTRFALTGQHKGLACRGCHTPARGTDLKLPTACVACHAADDVHRGAFGRRCGRCHGTGDFRRARLR